MLPAAIGLGTGLASYFGGLEGREASAEAVARQMDFQERMSGTSYQRAVKDLKLAGLNPMLAYTQGGASSPSGASFNAQDVATPAVNTGVSAAIQRQELKNLQLQGDNLASITRRINALLPEELRKIQTESLSNSASTALLSSSLPGARARAASDKTWYGKYVRPYLPEFLSSAGTAVKVVK